MNSSDDAWVAQVLNDLKRVKSEKIFPPGMTLNGTAEELAKHLFQMAESMANKKNCLPLAKEWGYSLPFWRISRFFQFATEFLALYCALIIGASIECKLSRNPRKIDIENLFMEELLNQAFMRDKPLALEFMARLSCYGKLIDSKQGGRELASAFFAVIKCRPVAGPVAEQRLKAFAEQIDRDKSLLCRIFRQTRVT